VGSITAGKMKGKAPKGRPRDKYLGHVKKDTGKKSHRGDIFMEWLNL
jgi:hypothetical protein